MIGAENVLRKFSSYAVGVQQESLVLFSDFQDGGLMWTGDGPRQMRQRITFAEPFRDVPVVTVSLSMWDIDNGTNSRMDISADKIDETGFDIVFKTWSDTRIARVRADWLAIGPCSNDEDWEID